VYLYELRIYTATPGRIADLVSRFENYTNRIGRKYGIEDVASFVSPVNRDLYVSLVRHELPSDEVRSDSIARAQYNWAAFQLDPEWIVARDASEVDGPLVVPAGPGKWSIQIEYLTETAFSPLHSSGDASIASKP
jgi:hypothetical protein